MTKQDKQAGLQFTAGLLQPRKQKQCKIQMIELICINGWPSSAGFAAATVRSAGFPGCVDPAGSPCRLASADREDDLVQVSLVSFDPS